jgi:hypothetical protein
MVVGACRGRLFVPEGLRRLEQAQPVADSFLRALAGENVFRCSNSTRMRGKGRPPAPGSIARLSQSLVNCGRAGELIQRRLIIGAPDAGAASPLTQCLVANVKLPFRKL